MSVDQNTVEEVNAQYLYNLLAVMPGDKAPAPLPVDLRPRNQFKQSHCRKAVNIDLENTSGPLDEVTLQKCCNEEGWPRFKWRNIFIVILIDVDDKTENIKRMIQFLTKQKLIKLCVLQGGYETFEKLYPFRCDGSKHSNTNDIHTFYPTQIVDNLYLGSYQNATSPIQISNLKITHILNCASECVTSMPYDANIIHFKVDWEDHNEFNIDSEFEKCFQFIEAANGNVLIHCYAGKSRSASLVIAFLMKKHKWSFRQAMSYVKMHRPNIDPNPGFISQLEKFEKSLDEMMKK
eukprot:TRINITY_DN13145_c0_g1_i1.p1 TRINITY_DN13145_c0_g1~~TRINITY_DN13145_c0_g1_i1.p1  ORF type:complete len:292 (+),score=39.89 TRINITY_DN13145_c0_g1_i1:50-925(+)